jgi:hypothetical protein
MTAEPTARQRVTAWASGRSSHGRSLDVRLGSRAHGLDTSEFGTVRTVPSSFGLVEKEGQPDSTDVVHRNREWPSHRPSSRGAGPAGPSFSPMACPAAPERCRHTEEAEVVMAREQSRCPWTRRSSMSSRTARRCTWRRWGSSGPARSGISMGRSASEIFDDSSRIAWNSPRSCGRWLRRAFSEKHLRVA